MIRIAAGKGAYYDAVLLAANHPTMAEETRNKLNGFLALLEIWREEARRGALAELLWRIYRETGYYDLVGGMPGGLQRQANLRALHDRARQYEATTLRGLFRFLRFIDRMREGGGDLGTARALGEQEDVVRIMSIHKSKGLEFPVVFIAGLGKAFNRRDLNSPFLMHKQLGLGPKFVDRHSSESVIRRFLIWLFVKGWDGDARRRNADPVCGVNETEGKNVPSRYGSRCCKAAAALADGS